MATGVVLLRALARDLGGRINKRKMAAKWSGSFILKKLAAEALCLNSVEMSWMIE